MNLAPKASPTYDKSTVKIIILACIVIVLSTLFTGIVGYYITQQAVVNKLKNQDLIYIIESMAAKIDGRIKRAQETSLVLAEDPAVLAWIVGREKDETLGDYAKQKITNLAKQYDYSNSFIVSSLTGHYWAEKGKLIDTMNAKDPDDSWFFATINSQQRTSLIIDYNQERNNTFVFVNVLMGDLAKPLGVTGVGLSLHDIAEEFQRYKFGKESNLWLIDKKGEIQLSQDLGHNGKNIEEFTSSQVKDKIISNLAVNSSQPFIFQYLNQQGQTIDLVAQPIQSTEWKLVFQIPRSESIGILNYIKINILLAVMFSMLLIIFIFYLVSYRMANPLKRAISLNQELEKMVLERTQELTDKNNKITDSIDYAKRIQESMLPSITELEEILEDSFVIWRPRDLVGGDFYWLKKFKRSYILAIGDCTGHGVPGAFMTMAVNSILNYIVDEICHDDPAHILKELNRRVQQTIHKNDSDRMRDDGLDLGICYVRDNKEVIFAGARISLYLKKGNSVEIIKGDRASIGYKSSDLEYNFTNHFLQLGEDTLCYLTTDGYLDQNGGDKDYCFGKKRFIEIISNNSDIPLREQGQIFKAALEDYMIGKSQRDDITVIGFRV